MYPRVLVGVRAGIGMVRWAEVAATVVERHDLVQRRKLAVVKERRAQSRVSDTRCAELAEVTVVGDVRDRLASDVLGRRPNANVVKLIVRKKRSNMTATAISTTRPGRIEYPTAALRGGAQRCDPGGIEIDGSL